MVVPGRLPSVGSVDAREDDHGNGSDAVAKHGQRLLSARPRASFATLFAVIGAPTRTSLLGCGFVSVRHLDQWRRDGLIRSVQIGARTHRYHPDDVAEFVRRRRG
jgi:hypothetical protein